MSKLNTTTYNNVAANTVDDAVLDASKILAWRQNVKAVVDGNDDLRIAHENERVSHLISVTRDISLTGVQAVTFPFKAKSINCIALINSSASYSLGFYAESPFQRCIFYNPVTNKMTVNTFLIEINDGTNLAFGLIQNVTDTGFEINWTKTGSPTGTASLLILGSTH